MKRKKTVLFVLASLICIILTGCGITPTSKPKITEPIECTEITLPDGYSPMMVEDVDANGNVYVLGCTMKDTETWYDTFVFHKGKDGYYEPEKLDVENKDIILGRMCISEDGESVFFWAWKFMDTGEYEIRIYKGYLEGTSLNNIREVDELNISNINLVVDLFGNDNLYLLNYNQEKNAYDAFVAEKEDSVYRRRKLDINFSNNYISSLISVGNEQALVLLKTEEEHFAGIYLLNLKDTTQITQSEVKLPKELDGKEIHDISVNNKEDTIYFVVRNNKDNYLENTVYKMSLKTFLEGTEQNHTSTSDITNYIQKCYEMILGKKQKK